MAMAVAANVSAPNITVGGPITLTLVPGEQFLWSVADHAITRLCPVCNQLHFPPIGLTYRVDYHNWHNDRATITFGGAVTLEMGLTPYDLVPEPDTIVDGTVTRAGKIIVPDTAPFRRIQGGIINILISGMPLPLERLITVRRHFSFTKPAASQPIKIYEDDEGITGLREAVGTTDILGRFNFRTFDPPRNFWVRLDGVNHLLVAGSGAGTIDMAVEDVSAAVKLLLPATSVYLTVGPPTIGIPPEGQLFGHAIPVIATIYVRGPFDTHPEG